MREAGLFQRQLGCVAPRGFGLAVGLPHRRVVSPGTDGGLMLNLGILANEWPRNPVVAVWDNACHQTIGGPPTHTLIGRMNLAAIARGAGIGEPRIATDLDAFDALRARGLLAQGSFVLVAKVDRTCRRDIARTHSDGREDKYVFVRHDDPTEDVTIMGRPEHDG